MEKNTTIAVGDHILQDTILYKVVELGPTWACIKRTGWCLPEQMLTTRVIPTYEYSLKPIDFTGVKVDVKT